MEKAREIISSCITNDDKQTSSSPLHNVQGKTMNHKQLFMLVH